MQTVPTFVSWQNLGEQTVACDSLLRVRKKISYIHKKDSDGDGQELRMVSMEA